LECLGLTPDDRTLEYRSFGWNSAQVLSLMPFLETGLTLHIARRFSHSRFFDWIRTHGISFAVGVPTVVNMLLNKPLGYTAKDVPTLRLMSCSTAPLTPEQWLRFEDMYGVKLLQMYGMSEGGLDLLQSALQEQDGDGRSSRAVSGFRDRRRAGTAMPAQCRGRGDRRRSALPDRLSAR
jgi:acyl-coenzyme A synthetase/AMP-(fatty) acid ligase